MSGSVNKVILVGNVGNQPEIRVSQGGGSEIANFSIATSERWKDKNSGEQREKTDWHRVVVFAPGLVNIVKNYVNKGSKVYIEGKLQTREYMDKEGIKKYTTEVVLTQYNSTLTLLDSKGGDSRHNENHFENNNQESKYEEFDPDNIKDEIPF
ncbi:single-stranded DNA-binding protein [Candidatus Bandiella numerosa]|jgi:single-strand DNA-binding protein|uniref:single-stranded DNA-binding protein n=1 Tax=Candidatus Bandiella numerosa TaxID=2570586 RepID=UPI00249DCCDA|nr:single-stranded DNA-binding protein [Candidatus Bandiella numerosa]WHA04751.1 single-stranded DNA-binding protein [Candidatus Bandiella numerosa]